MLLTVSILVTGKVQGVYFRQSTREKATELGLTGQVKNLPDGSVYIMATGTIEQLNQLEDWCRQGPPRAVIAGVEITELPLKEFEHFTITRL